MDSYLLLRLLHFTGIIFLGGGLLAVFVSEWRSYGTKEPAAFAEAAYYSAIFYDVLVVPGAIMMWVSGPLLIWWLGLGWFAHPWLAGMWWLFLFEFVEGNTVTRIQFRRTLRLSRSFPPDEPLTGEKRRIARTRLAQVAHFLDIPLFSVIVYCGVMRPEQWQHVAMAIGVAMIVAASLTIFVPRLARAA